MGRFLFSITFPSKDDDDDIDVDGESFGGGLGVPSDVCFPKPNQICDAYLIYFLQKIESYNN